ncbi:5-oxoprolinase/urea amidolyase family protein [Streptomyces sp. SID13031]|uniref:5-oxoprolinase/urea amidolyase family protein n=1 Tax=Streptomyces sp. SID13031 TaxID=2706046 RepID=UPI0013C880DE|nr:5-oxoprolinase/urea amidolyase family protein [Streptomyces sp. SID13031]NEA31430.1 5-oxoprolinase/urea amidolyase family protein [Streptomyces sp. SID13031]
MAGVTIVAPGMQTTVQDLAGRQGLWDVGVPPSGAVDELTFALLNAAVGNPSNAAGLECVVAGPVLRLGEDRLVCVGGAATRATIDGYHLRPGTVARLVAGATLDVGPLDGPGMRGYVAVEGGLDVPRVLGSRSTFVLGEFGGLDGRALVAGDLLPLGRRENLVPPATISLPVLTHEWTLRVIAGPHGAPEHLTFEGVDTFFSTTWQIDHRSDRTGIRLVGPIPGWARTDGGEAGLHPSNVHDSAYPVGGIMLSGDTPVIVGKDGPSLGGFVVPAVVIEADRWLLGQLRPGDTLHLHPVTPAEATEAMNARRRWLADLRQPQQPVALNTPTPNRPIPLPAQVRRDSTPRYTIRLAGERHLLVEAGSLELDLTVRVWIHLLAEALRADLPAGVTEIVEGVRSVLVAVDSARLQLEELAAHLVVLANGLADPAEVVLPAREVVLPIAFDHPLAHEAMRRYAASVRPDAPWCPDNVEFIRRVNDLDERAEVFDIVAEATYLVVGLGDVYLGAPVAVPIDPRHRLVTTKYNPARTWTPQNAVGIGGIYLCIYGMEGPGGYQLVGRTVPVWRLSERDEQPWLLRQFDRIRFTPVSTEELDRQRADIKAGRADLQVTPATFSIADVRRIEQEAPMDIVSLRAKRRAAFDAERARWGA